MLPKTKTKNCQVNQKEITQCFLILLYIRQFTDLLKLSDGITENLE